MHLNESSEESIGAYLNSNDIDKISEGKSSRPNQGTLIAGTGEQKPVSHYQADETGSSRKSAEAITQLGEMKKKETQKPGTFPVSKKREGTPLDDEEKRKRKRIADQKYRGTTKGTKKKLQAANSEAKRLEIANELLNERNKDTLQNLHDVLAEKGKLQYKYEKLQNKNKKVKAHVKDIEDQLQAANCKSERIESAFELLKEKFQKLQDADTENERLKDHVGEMEEELLGLKRIKASLKAENEAMTNDLQKAATDIEELRFKIDSLNKTNTQQQEWVNMFPNGLNFEDLLMEQDPLWQEGNEVWFGGYGGSVMHSEMSRQANAEEARNDRAEPTTQMLEGLPEMHAVRGDKNGCTCGIKECLIHLENP